MTFFDEQNDRIAGVMIPNIALVLRKSGSEPPPRPCLIQNMIKKKNAVLDTLFVGMNLATESEIKTHT